ncbi:MAG: GNAT family N-acetyltransferase [Proteobacteria bacterium]|nr:GNAT family N-acetyltransferase [Pseudomonadota bacterium]
MNIEYTKNPASNDIDFLTKQINQETSEYGEAYPFAFFMRDDEAEIIAGANGFVIYGAIYTDQLWVDKEYRGQGFAKKIMDKVHEFGLLEGCKIATVQTMSFQGAHSFYEKLGYVQDFKRTGYVNGSNCIFMRKAL